MTVLGFTVTSATTSFKVGSFSHTSIRLLRIACLACWTICRYAGILSQASNKMTDCLSTFLVMNSDSETAVGTSLNGIPFKCLDENIMIGIDQKDLITDPFQK